MRNLNAVVTIAHRDLLKFLRDPGRIVGSLVFPLFFIGVLGGSLQANLGQGAGYNLLDATFTGIFALTLFQSTTQGIISLIEDRENDFSQEIFVAPISRYAIIFGKILGETLVSLAQGASIVLFAVVGGVNLSPARLLALVPAAILSCLLGGAFGVVLIANFGSQRVANQILPYLIFPQFFLAGIFYSVKTLSLPLDILSRISPLRYAVDLTRDVFYAGRPDYEKVVLAGPLLNLVVIAAMFVVFLVVGTALFVRRERNR
jgi:ABC-2 type transport system permease protein